MANGIPDYLYKTPGSLEGKPGYEPDKKAVGMTPSAIRQNMSAPDNSPTRKIDWAGLGAGFTDEFLLGLPEFAAKNLGNRTKIQAWIDAHPDYHPGEQIGSLASAVVPWGKVAKSALGIPTVAAKGVDAAADIMKAAGVDASIAGKAAAGAAAIAKDAPKGIAKLVSPEVLKMAGKIGGFQAAEAGIRGITSEKTPQEIIRDMAIGGGVGAAAGGLTGSMANRAKLLAKEGEESIEKGILGRLGINKRLGTSFLKEYAAPGSKGLNLSVVAGDGRKDLLGLVDKYDMLKAGMMERGVENYQAMWIALQKTFDKMNAGMKGSDIIGKAVKNLGPSGAMADLLQEHSAKDIAGVIDDLMAKSATREGMYSTGKLLTDRISDMRKLSETDAGGARLIREVTDAIKTQVDMGLTDAASAMGITDPKFIQNLKSEYLGMRFLGKINALDEWTPKKASSGPPTMEKLAVAGAFGVGGGALGNKDTPIEDRLVNAGKAALLGYGTAMIKGGTGSAIDIIRHRAGQPIAAALVKAAPAIEDAAYSISNVVGRATSKAVIMGVDAANPKTTAQEKAAQTGAVVGAATGAGVPDKYVDVVMRKLKTFYDSTPTAKQYGNDGFMQFAQGIAAQTDNFAPDKMANLLYSTAEERSSYLSALKVSKALAGQIETATKPGTSRGILGIGFHDTPEEKVAKTVAQDRIVSTIMDMANKTGSGAVAKKLTTDILGGKGTIAEKTDALYNVLRQYGVDMSTLTKVGL